VVERVADAATQRSHQLDLLGKVGVGRGAKPRKFVPRQIIQDRQIGLNAQKQARRQNTVISRLDATAEAAERAAETGRIGLAQPDLGAASAVPDMAAEIEAAPIVEGDARGSLHRQPDGHVGGVDGVAQADGEDRRAKPARSSSDHCLPPKFRPHQPWLFQSTFTLQHLNAIANELQ
jgi:hypothetical protein